MELVLQDGYILNVKYTIKYITVHQKVYGICLSDIFNQSQSLPDDWFLLDILSNVTKDDEFKIIGLVVI